MQNKMFDRKNRPWKDVGTDVSQLTELTEVLEKSGLDFTVEKSPVLFSTPIKYPIEDGGDSAALTPSHKLDGFFVTYRTDNNHPFGVVGSKYEIVQNIEAFRFIELLYKDADVVYETAGIFNEGSRMFVTVQLPGGINLSANDRVDKYIVFTTTHDGSGSITIVITGVRPICENTLMLAISKASNKFIIKHTKNADSRIDAARKLIRAQSDYFNKLGETLTQLKKINLGEQGISQILAYMFLTTEEYQSYIQKRYKLIDNDILSTKKQNTIKSVREALNEAPGQALYTNSGLWVYNGLTSYIHNVREYRDADYRFTSIFDDKYGAKLSHVVETMLNTI